jgi:hypothetical protein
MSPSAPVLRVLLLGLAIGAAACSGSTPADPTSPAPRPLSYAVYTEYARDANKLMKGGLNRRVFNKVESQSGSDITLNGDGSITLAPGTYRISGVSTVTMQTTFAPPRVTHDNNYPGYAMVYPVSAESAGMGILKQAIAIGTPNTASDLAPSVFDAIYTATARTDIAVGHQSGDDLHDEVYLSVYDVNGAKSDYHAVARIAITRMEQ